MPLRRPGDLRKAGENSLLESREQPKSPHGGGPKKMDLNDQGGLTSGGSEFLDRSEKLWRADLKDLLQKYINGTISLMRVRIEGKASRQTILKARGEGGDQNGREWNNGEKGGQKEESSRRTDHVDNVRRMGAKKGLTRNAGGFGG